MKSLNLYFVFFKTMVSILNCLIVKKYYYNFIPENGMPLLPNVSSLNLAKNFTTEGCARLVYNTFIFKGFL